MGVSGESGLRFDRMGEVLAAEEDWEGRRVAAPAVLVSAGWLPGETPGLASVLMWYQGGPAGREGIALAARQTPAEAEYVDFGW